VAAKVQGTVMMWQFDAAVRQRGSQCHRLSMMVADDVAVSAVGYRSYGNRFSTSGGSKEDR
jgi:hypothetical protein